MLKASELVSFCNAMIGQAYWYGTCVYKCTKELAKKKAKQFPKYYTEYTTEELLDAINKKKVCMDCVGLPIGFFWTNGGKGVIEYLNGTGDFTIIRKANGIPSKSANGLFEWCKDQGAKYGKISTMPDVAGIIVHKSGHVGVYIGNGYVVEAMGHNYGVVKTELNKRPWTSWFYLPSWILEYDTKDNVKDSSQNIVNNISTPSSTSVSYRCGDSGTQVAKIQKMLIACGYTLGKNVADGIFDDATEADLKAFQTAHGLIANGIYEQKTHDMLMSVYKNAKQQIATNSTNKQTVKVTGSKVNIRTEPNMSAKILDTVKCNTKFIYCNQTLDGWHKIIYKNKTAWISADYSVII